MKSIKSIIEQFNIPGRCIDIQTINTGNINRTYIVSYLMDNGNIKKYIVQKINTTVFKEPYKLMKNIDGITKWIEKVSKESNDFKHPFLSLIHTKEDDLLSVIKDEAGEKLYYRAYNCIENSISYDGSKDTNVVYNAGQAFGHFQKLLLDYPTKNIEDTIPDFHNTYKRYLAFLEDLEKDVCNRAKEVSKEIEFIKSNSYLASAIVDLLNKGLIPERVIHNDTKVNNVMLDKDTGEYLTVIDLDTVMLGSSLYDYGDGIRSAAANSLEDEEDLEKVWMVNELFESYTKGYLSEMAPYLTYEEVKNMGLSIEVITYELALRFLNDYINGDTYFKTNYSKHNLVRTRNQIKLLSDIKSKKSYIENYVQDTYTLILKEK